MSGASAGSSCTLPPSGLRPRWLVAANSLAPLRNAPFALFVVGILSYGAAFAWDTLDRFDLLNLVRDGFRDDAFYYFQIAYHMAEGRFSTFDGGLTRTNGYHPLWLFLVTPFYWVFDKTEALFAIKAFEIMLLAGGVALVAVAARVARLPWILLFAALPALYAQRGMLFGMEAAAGLFTLGLLFLATCLFGRDSDRWRWPLAAVVFALPWVRLEYAAIAVAVTAALCFIEWTGRPPGAPGTTAGGSPSSHGLARLRFLRLRAAVPLAGAFASILVYFAYNGVVFGGVVPVSGAVKALWSQRMFREEGGYDLASNFDAYARLEFFDDELLTALEVCVYALLVWWLSRRFRSRESRLLLVFLVAVFGLAAGHLAKFAQSVLFVHPDFGGFRWYFVPAYLMEALVVPVRCFVGVYVLRCVLGRRLPRTSDVLRFGGIVVAGSVLLAKADFAAPFRFVDTHDETRFYGRDNDPGQRRHGFDGLHSYMGVAVMNRLLPENTLVGSFDSGVVAYFARARVMNLDGLVNSYGNKEALGDRDNVFDMFGLSYVGNVFSKSRPLSLFGEDRLVFETHANGLWGPKHFRLYSLGEYPARFRERMAALLERQADGTGLLASGRLAQAFATECAADEVAEWTFDARVGAISTWTRAADGSCASAAVLPHPPSSPPRVRRTALGEAVAGWAGGKPPAIRADADNGGGFDVYLVGSRLLYVKEVCEQGDVRTPFFLHLMQVGDDFEETGLAASRSFLLKDYGNWVVDGHCLADVPLPNGSGAVIRTGQYTADGRVWHGEIHRAQPTTEGA